MSGRLLSGWGGCVRCGETLKPEDKDNSTDFCEFCTAWSKLAKIVIDREINAEKKISNMKKDQISGKQVGYKFEGAMEYWTNKKESYDEIHKIMIQALKVKKRNLWGETY